MGVRKELQCQPTYMNQMMKRLHSCLPAVEENQAECQCRVSCDHALRQREYDTPSVNVIRLPPAREPRSRISEKLFPHTQVGDHFSLQIGAARDRAPPHDAFQHTSSYDIRTFTYQHPAFGQTFTCVGCVLLRTSLNLPLDISCRSRLGPCDTQESTVGHTVAWASRCVVQLLCLLRYTNHVTALSSGSSAPSGMAQPVATRSGEPVSPDNSIPDFPDDVFFLIFDYLQVWEVARCQLVSKSWQQAFSKDAYLQKALRRYPFARELENIIHQLPESDNLSQYDWRTPFNSIARRYFHVSHGKVRQVVRHKLAPSEQTGHYYHIGQWDYHESQPGGRLYFENAASQSFRLTAKPHLFHATLWSYSGGLLVFAPAQQPPCAKPTEILALLDLNTNQTFRVPFDISSKIIRNLRLHDRTLIVEWAERDPFHNLNDMEQVNRHFASCFDVVPCGSSTGNGPERWDVKQRSEFKLHFLGLPLNSRDRFFSTHNRRYYAIYLFQPNRSMYSGDEDLPIESLFVWDISKASKYQPSQDPSGQFRPQDASEGPHIVARFPFNALEFLGIRQHSQIRLMSLSLDTASASLTWRENVCVAGQGYFDPAERLWCAKTTSFPFLGEGPHLQRDWDGYLPPYRGHGSMESADVDEDGLEKWFVPVMDIVDDQTNVRLSLVETCFTGLSMMENKLIVRIQVPWKHDDGEYVVLEDAELMRDVSVMGRIAGDERWVIGQNESMELVILKF